MKAPSEAPFGYPNDQGGSTVRVRQRASSFLLLRQRFRCPGWRRRWRRRPRSVHQRPPWPLSIQRMYQQRHRLRSGQPSSSLWRSGLRRCRVFPEAPGPASDSVPADRVADRFGVRGRVGAEGGRELRVVEHERLLELLGDFPHGAKRGVHGREQGEQRRGASRGGAARARARRRRAGRTRASTGSARWGRARPRPAPPLARRASRARSRSSR
jgi:hypothetical protein